MPYPYLDLEGTPLWDVLYNTVQDLVSNQNLEETTDRRYIVGYIARQLLQAGLGSPSRGPVGAEEATRIQVLSGAEKVELVPVGRDESVGLPADRLYELRINRQPKSRLAFIDCYAPSVALHLQEVFIWAGTRLYRQSLERESTLQVIDFDYELHAIYPVGGNQCLVFEILVEVRSHDLGTILQSFDLREIILEDWWMDGTLHLQDLRGRSFEFSPTGENGALLTQISGDALGAKP